MMKKELFYHKLNFGAYAVVVFGKMDGKNTRFINKMLDY